MGCKGCGKAKKKDVPKTAQEYLGPVDASNNFDVQVASVRLAICVQCSEAVYDKARNPTNRQLLREQEGELYCGDPNDPNTGYNPQRFGCGRDLRLHTACENAECPRGLWGPGREFKNIVAIAFPGDNPNRLPNVLDFIGPTVREGGQLDCSGIGDTLLQGVVAQAIQRHNKSKGIHLRFLTVEARTAWAKLSCPDTEILSMSDAHRIPGEFVQSSAPLRAIEIDATCRMQGHNRHQFLARQFGVPIEEVEKWEIPLDTEALAEADEFLARARKAKRPVICVSPYAHSSTRQWPLYHWCKLIKSLEKLRYAVFILQPPSADGHHDPLRTMPGHRFSSPDPRRVAAVVARSDILIGNDSGMCHLAGALRKPALAICAVTEGSVVFGGWPTVRTLQAPGACSGCLWYQDGGWQPWCGFGCDLLADVKPPAVISRVEEILREEGVL